MIGYVLILLLVINRELSNAMEEQISSSEWEAVAADRRALLASQAPLQSPVPSRPSRPNHSLVAAIVVLMVLAIAAIVCCCYLWDQQLRLRIQARNREPSAISLPDLEGGSHRHSSNSQLLSATPSTMVVSIGGDLPHSMAWGVPHGVIPPVAQAALHPTLNPSLEKLVNSP